MTGRGGRAGLGAWRGSCSHGRPERAEEPVRAGGGRRASPAKREIASGPRGAELEHVLIARAVGNAEASGGEPEGSSAQRKPVGVRRPWTLCEERSDERAQGWGIGG